MAIVCQYCNASNPEKEKECVACGAPLVLNKIITNKSNISKPEKPEKPDQSVETARKIAGLYSSVMLAVLDAIIIVAVSMAIGLASGIVNQPVLGVLGAALLGFAVSITIKNGLVTIISAPIGLLIGSILWFIAMIYHFPTFTFPILLAGTASFTAIYGGHQDPIRFDPHG